MGDRESQEFRNTTNKIHVTNIASHINWDEVEKLFGTYGHIVHIEIDLNSKNDGAFGAIITYESPENAQAALEKLNGFELHGFVLKVVYSMGDSSPDSSSPRVNVNTQSLTVRNSDRGSNFPLSESPCKAIIEKLNSNIMRDVHQFTSLTEKNMIEADNKAQKIYDDTETKLKEKVNFKRAWSNSLDDVEKYLENKVELEKKTHICRFSQVVMSASNTDDGSTSKICEGPAPKRSNLTAFAETEIISLQSSLAKNATRWMTINDFIQSAPREPGIIHIKIKNNVHPILIDQSKDIRRSMEVLMTPTTDGHSISDFVLTHQQFILIRYMISSSYEETTEAWIKQMSQFEKVLKSKPLFNKDS